MVLHNLQKCNKGVAAIEFAIIAPILFLLLMGIIELLLAMYVTAILEGATSVGSRLGRTGYTEGDRETFIRSEIERLTGGFLNPGDLSVQTLSYTSYDNIGRPEPCIDPTVPDCVGGIPDVDCIDINGNGTCDADMGREGAGGAGDVVLYVVTYPWRIVTPMIRVFIGDGSGIYNATAVSAVRNEPFR